MTRFETPRNWHIELLLGNIPNMSEVETYGHNPDIDTTSFPEDIWDRGGIYVPPTVAQTIRVYSSGAGAANDTAAGTGARTIEVTGHNAAGEEVSETFTMNGTTAVYSVSTWTAVYGMRVLTAGTSEVNEGTILCIANTDVTVQGQITADFGHSLHAIYKVPVGCTLCIEEWGASVNKTGGGGTEADFRLQVKKDGGAWNTEAFEGAITTGTSAFTQNLFVAAPELSWVRVQCTYVSANNTDVSGFFEGPLVTV